MLLRRITKHVKDQNWFAVALDFFIVVVGVFVGIQVSNWNAMRLERAIEKDTLIRLHADIEDSITGQIRDIRFLEQQLSDQNIVLSSLEVCNVATENENAFQRGLATLGWINPPRLYRRTIDEITASGRTDIISNPDIADGLANVIALVEWRETYYTPTMMSVVNYQQKVEPNIRYRMDRILDNPFVPNHRGGVDYNIDVMCKNMELSNTISAVSYVTSERLEAYQPILAAYKSLSPVIAAELQNGWGVDLLRKPLP